MTQNPNVKMTWNDPIPPIKITVKKGMMEIGENIVNEAKSYASGFSPKATGRLMNSLMLQMEGKEYGFDGSPATSADKLHEKSEPLTMYVGTNVKYAIYQEMGTRKMAAHPMIRPAIAIWGQGKPVVEVMKKWDKIRSSGPLKTGQKIQGF
jgi:hypothetical protein